MGDSGEGHCWLPTVCPRGPYGGPKSSKVTMAVLSPLEIGLHSLGASAVRGHLFLLSWVAFKISSLFFCFLTYLIKNLFIFRRGRSQDGGGIAQGDHFLS